MRLGLHTGVVTNLGRPVSGPPWTETWQSSLEKIRIADDLGYDTVVVPESWNLASVPWLALIANQTKRIRVGSSILNVFSRSPSTLAQEVATLEVISGGRVVLGIGVSAAPVIERFHGVPFERPLRRLREYVEVVKLLLAGEQAEYEGEVVRLHGRFRLVYDRPQDTTPVWVAAITPRSIEQAGEVADGVMPVHWPASSFPALRGQMASGAARAGRDAETLTVAPHTQVFPLDGRDDATTWRAAREAIEFYVNRMGDFYWQMLSRNGWEADIRASRTAFTVADREGAVAAISDEMVRAIHVIGSLEEIREQLGARSAAGADVQLIYMPQGEPKAVGRLLESLLR